MKVNKETAIAELKKIVGEDRVITDPEVLKNADAMNRSYAKAFGFDNLKKSPWNPQKLFMGNEKDGYFRPFCFPEQGRPRDNVSWAGV